MGNIPSLIRSWVSLVLIAFMVVGCIKSPSQPSTSETLQSSPGYHGKELLVTSLPPEQVIQKLLPNLNFSWLLERGDESNSMHSYSEIPRIPEVLLIKNVTANLHGEVATPLVEDGRIFLSDGKAVYVLSESGEKIWEVSIYERFDRFVSAYGLGKYLFIGTTSYLDMGNGYLLALDKDTGKIMWKQELKVDPEALSKSSVTSNLLVIGDKIFLGSIRDEGYVFSFTQDGKLLWKTKLGGTIRGLAYGENILFVTSEPLKNVWALDAENGKVLWVYKHDSSVSTPVYTDENPMAEGGEKLFFIDGRGHLVSLDALTGKLEWRKGIGGGSDVNTNAFLGIDGIGGRIYAPRVIGERPLTLHTIGFDGEVLGTFQLKEDERLGIPLIARQIVILPVIANNYFKLYFLWKGVSKLYEFKMEGEEIYMPKVAVGSGKVYAVFSYDRMHQVLVVFGDTKKPEIKNVEEKEHDGIWEVKALAQDEQSDIYMLVIAYKEGENWHYVEMELSRRYVMEPIGGYGFNEEEYVATIPTREYLLICIDNVGNYVLWRS